MKNTAAIFTLLAIAALSQTTGQAAKGTLSAWGGGQRNAPAGLANVTAISSAIDHSLALRSDGTVVAWGENFDGQCLVPESLKAKAVAAGAFFSVAVRSNGTAVVWGDSQWGQADVPLRITNLVAVSAGRAHVLGLRSDSTVVGWGSETYGQLDIPPNVTRSRQVLARWNYSAVLLTNGTVIAWGSNDAGQTNVPAWLNRVTAIDGDENYMVALKTDGTLVTWGDAPAVPGGLTGVTAIAAGDDHVLAMKSDGTVVAFGVNDAGQLNVPSGLKAQAIAAGWRHSLAVGSGVAVVTRLVLFNPRVQQGTFTVSFDSTAGSAYAMEYQEGSTAGNWSPLSPQTASSAVMSLSDPNLAATSRFYRVRQD